MEAAGAAGTRPGTVPSLIAISTDECAFDRPGLAALGVSCFALFPIAAASRLLADRIVARNLGIF